MAETTKNTLFANLDIHGYPVIAIAALPDQPATIPNLRVVLVDRGEEYQHDRYIVSLWQAGAREWLSGTYFNKYADAIACFAEKAAQNYWLPPKQEPQGVPFICCPLAALTMMTGRAIQHSHGCANRRP